MKVAYKIQTSWEVARSLMDWGLWPENEDLDYPAGHLRWNDHPTHQPAHDWARGVLESGRNATNDRAAWGVLSACRIDGGAGLDNESLNGKACMSGNGNLFMVMASKSSNNDLFNVYILMDATRGYVRDHIRPMLEKAGIDVVALSATMPLLYETEAPLEMSPLETRGEYVVRMNQTEEVWREEIEPFAKPIWDEENGMWRIDTPQVWMHEVAVRFAEEKPDWFNMWAQSKYEHQERMRQYENRSVVSIGLN